MNIVLSIFVEVNNVMKAFVKDLQDEGLLNTLQHFAAAQTTSFSREQSPPKKQ